MSTIRSALALAGLALIAAPVYGQERGIVLQVEGGGYSHTRNLNATGNDAHFKTGFNVGGSVGIQFTRYVSVHGDFTMSQTEGSGAVNFAGRDVNRYFYGGHVQLRYPFDNGLAPFVFGGGGGIRIDQQGPEAEEQFAHFTKAAGTFGAGIAYRIPNSAVEFLFQGKAFGYKWDAGAFDRTQWDVAYSAGVAYRFRL